MARTEVVICTVVSASTNCSASVRRREASAWPPRDRHVGQGGGDRRRLLLRSARRLLGAAGDLLHGPAELFRRSRGLRQAGRHLLGRCGDALRKFFLAERGARTRRRAGGGGAGRRRGILRRGGCDLGGFDESHELSAR